MSHTHTAFLFGAGAVLTVPALVRAEGVTLTSILDAFAASIGAFVGVGVALALFLFMWGVVRSIYATKGSTELAAARGQMVWGLVALTILVSVWGFVKILQAMTGADGTETCTSPSMTIGDSVETESCF